MFKDRLKEARKAKGLTQEALASLIGVKKPTLSGYETGNSEPDMAKIVSIMQVLEVDANYLWQDEMMEAKISEKAPLSQKALTVAYAYDSASTYGKTMIDAVVDQEKLHVVKRRVPMVTTSHDSDIYARYLAKREAEEAENDIITHNYDD